MRHITSYPRDTRDIRGWELLLEQPCLEIFSDPMIAWVSVKGYLVWKVTLARERAPVWNRPKAQVIK